MRTSQEGSLGGMNGIQGSERYGNRSESKGLLIHPREIAELSAIRLTRHNRSRARLTPDHS